VPQISVTQQAIEEIKAMIIRGELGPGDRLPKESDLAARLGLSRNSPREAVRALTPIRILETRQGDGTYVTSLEPEILIETIGFVADFHQDRTPLHVLEVRRVLEAAATALAAQYIGPDELGALADLVDEMDACETVEALVANDLAFHRAIAVASRNPVLASLLDSFSTRTSGARMWRGVTQADAVEARGSCRGIRPVARRSPTSRAITSTRRSPTSSRPTRPTARPATRPSSTAAT
jgi:GntR family transcriptional regulator, transcriptional repressor for pyruvate dehydrogenase complex